MAIVHQNKKASRRLPVQGPAPPRISPLGPTVATGGVLIIAGALGYGFLREEPQAETPAAISAPPPSVARQAEPEAPRPPVRGAARPYTVPAASSRSDGPRAARPADYAPKVDGRVLASVPAGSQPSAGPQAERPRPVARAELKPGLVPLSPEEQARARKNMEGFEAEYRKRKLEEAARQAEESLKAPAVEARRQDGARDADVQLDGRPGDVPTLSAARLATVDKTLAELKARQTKGEALPAPLAKVLQEHGWEGLRRAAIREMAKHPEGSE